MLRGPSSPKSQDIRLSSTNPQYYRTKDSFVHLLTESTDPSHCYIKQVGSWMKYHHVRSSKKMAPLAVASSTNRENSHILLDANRMASISAHIIAWKTLYWQLFKMHSGAGSLRRTPSHVLMTTNAQGRLGTYVLLFHARWENTMSSPTLSNQAIKQMV